MKEILLKHAKEILEELNTEDILKVDIVTNDNYEIGKNRINIEVHYKDEHYEPEQPVNNALNYDPITGSVTQDHLITDFPVAEE